MCEGVYSTVKYKAPIIIAADKKVWVGKNLPTRC